MISNPPGPTLLGVDIIWVGSIMAGIAALAVMLVIYAAITVHDPMIKRVKALNERREQLKAGVIVAPRKRAKLVRTNESTDKIRDILN